MKPPSDLTTSRRRGTKTLVRLDHASPQDETANRRTDRRIAGTLTPRPGRATADHATKTAIAPDPPGSRQR